jgi:hypothetical protein
LDEDEKILAKDKEEKDEGKDDWYRGENDLFY